MNQGKTYCAFNLRNILSIEYKNIKYDKSGDCIITKSRQQSFNCGI